MAVSHTTTQSDLLTRLDALSLSPKEYSDLYPKEPSSSTTTTTTTTTAQNVETAVNFGGSELAVALKEMQEQVAICDTNLNRDLNNEHQVDQDTSAIQIQQDVAVQQDMPVALPINEIEDQEVVSDSDSSDGYLATPRSRGERFASRRITLAEDRAQVEAIATPALEEGVNILDNLVIVEIPSDSAEEMIEPPKKSRIWSIFSSKPSIKKKLTPLWNTVMQNAEQLPWKATPGGVHGTSENTILMDNLRIFIQEVNQFDFNTTNTKKADYENSITEAFLKVWPKTDSRHRVLQYHITNILKPGFVNIINI